MDQTIKQTITKAVKIGVIMFGCAIIGSILFVVIFTHTGISPVDQVATQPDVQVATVPDLEIGEIRNFTANKCIALTIYDISGTVEYEGDGHYSVCAQGWNKDGDKLLIIAGSTKYGFITDVSDGFRSFKYDRDYSDSVVKWFNRGY